MFCYILPHFLWYCKMLSLASHVISSQVTVDNAAPCNYRFGYRPRLRKQSLSLLSLSLSRINGKMSAKNLWRLRSFKLFHKGLPKNTNRNYRSTIVRLIHILVCIISTGVDVVYVNASDLTSKFYSVIKFVIEQVSK